MKQIYSHIFKFETTDYIDSNKLNNNVISIIEEDSKKHYVNYIQYEYNEDNIIFSREINIKVDRFYYLEIANSSIDNIERKKRLFTIIGKRCFGRNDNKLDCYFLDKDLDPKEIYECFEEHKADKFSHPILHELITHTVNKYEAYPFYCQNEYFAVLKQTNISNRKTFEKTFLVQMAKPDYTKLLAYQTNELKIEFIFNLIGKVHFKDQPLVEKTFEEIEHSAENMLESKLEDISDGSVTNQTFLNEQLFDSLKNKVSDIENIYFSFLSRGLKIIHEPDNDEMIFLFCTSISEAISIIEDEELFEEIVSFLEIIKIIIKEKKLSYLITKKDQDIQDIFLFLLETVTVWNTTLNEDSLGEFNRATIDLYNTLKYFIDRYFKFYYDYRSIDAKTIESEASADKNEELVEDNYKVSAKDFFEDMDFDTEVLDEVSEVQSELESCLYTESFNEMIEEKAHEFLQSYIHMLNTFYEFQNIAYVLSILDDQVGKFINFDDNSEVMKYFKVIIEDLIRWKNEVFVDQSAKDIHYVDDSLYINIAQIDILLEDQKNLSESKFF